MSKPRVFWIFTAVDGKPTGVSESKPGSIRGAVCRGPDIEVIEMSAFKKTLNDLRNVERELHKECISHNKTTQLLYDECGDE